MERAALLMASSSSSSSSAAAVTAAAPKRVRKPTRVIKPKRIRKYWTPEEDKKLIACVKEHGAKHWDEIARKSGLWPSKTGRSCRMRWKDHKQPGINENKFTKEEDEIIIQEVLKFHGKIKWSEIIIQEVPKFHGKIKWSEIACKLHRRNGNQVKNYWNTYLSKKMPVSNEEELIGIRGSFRQHNDAFESSKKIPVSNEEELIGISGSFSQHNDFFESINKILRSDDDVFEKYLRRLKNENVRGDGFDL